MRNYNEDFFAWLKTARSLELENVEEMPAELRSEFERLMFLADIPFREIFGNDPEGVTDLLLSMLRPEEGFDENGDPMRIVFVEQDRVFVSPLTHVVAQTPLYAEDAEGRCFVFLYCDHRGPSVGESAAVFDAIHDAARKRGVPETELPDVFFIYITDYDLCRRGEQIMRVDSDEEGDLSKWHTIFFNAAALA